ncbi:MAG TPA: hypothetical protein VG055_26765 [Planctomycetaceae bacterium]|nr:hypothetical protein [Planctomycetaceae bacterium]
MSESQLRVKLLVAAGIVGASLLGASFVGCSATSPLQSSSPFASYNGSPMAPGGGMPGAMAYNGPPAAPGVNGYSQQNRRAFMAETQRTGSQQNLTAQEVVAMSRSGMPDTQIAIAIQQRGASLKATPGADQYLAANGVNPAVLNGPGPGVPYAPAYAAQQVAPASMGQQPGYPSAGMQFAQAGPPGAGNVGAPMNGALQQPATASGDPAVQAAGYQTAAGAPGYDASTAAGGQSWRPMAH